MHEKRKAENDAVRDLMRLGQTCSHKTTKKGEGLTANEEWAEEHDMVLKHASEDGFRKSVGERDYDRDMGESNYKANSEMPCLNYEEPNRNGKHALQQASGHQTFHWHNFRLHGFQINPIAGLIAA